MIKTRSSVLIAVLLLTSTCGISMYRSNPNTVTLQREWSNVAHEYNVLTELANEGIDNHTERTWNTRISPAAKKLERLLETSRDILVLYSENKDAGALLEFNKSIREIKELLVVFEDLITLKT